MRIPTFLVIVLLLSGCVSGHQQFYKSYIDAKTLNDIERLKSSEEPKVYGSNNLNKDENILMSKNYIVLGYSSFNGQYENESMVKAQARRVGATVVLVNSVYTNTQTTTSPLFIPSSTTTQHSGSVYGGGGYGGYSGTSTTYGNTVVPITTNQRRYNQVAVFFVKSTRRPIFGVYFEDLSNEQRVAIERNAGVVLKIIVEDTPAFYSNVLPGDILIEVNGSSVRNVQHALELLQAADTSKGTALFKVIRNKEEKIITITFDNK